MSELWHDYRDNNEPRPGASRAERAQCLRNRLWFNTARNLLFVGSATYLALAGLFCNHESRPTNTNMTRENVDDIQSIPVAKTRNTPSFDPLHPKHDEESAVVVE